MTKIKLIHYRIALAVLLEYPATGASSALAQANTGQGVFTAAQSKRGEAVYMQSCAQCHQADLSGHEPAPELAGDTFLSHWAGHSVGDLFTRVSATMPQGRPGTLTKDQYADLIAFLLDANGFPSGNAELKPDADALKAIQIAGQH